MRLTRRTLLGLVLLASVLPGAAGAPALAMSVPALGLDLSPYRGKVVYLDFWASWCAPCRFSFPWMSQTQVAFERQGLVIIAVNVDKDRNLADEFLQRNIAQFKIVYDPAGSIPSAYNIKAMPTSILIDRDGKVRYVHTGFFQDQENAYRSHITGLLSEKAP